MGGTAFGRIGGSCSIVAGVAGFVYAAAFLVLTRSDPVTGRALSALALMAGGLAAFAALVAVYERLRDDAPAAALWALLLGTVGVLGSVLHGGYDLAVALHPETLPAGGPTDLPSQVDPRGLLTFGVTALAVAAFSGLMRLGGGFSPGLRALGWLFASLLAVLYIGRLIILAPAHPVIAVAAVLAGFLAGPAWYIRLGLELLSAPRRT